VAIGVAQTPDKPKFAGRLVGIYDDRTGVPIDSAEIRDLTTNWFAFTTSTGTLTLFFVDTAGALLRIRKIGYKATTMFIGNSPNDPPLTVMLEPLTQVLPKVVTLDTSPKYTSPSLRGFEERRKSQLGQFVSEAILRSEENRVLGDVIRSHIPGLKVREGVGGAMYAFSQREGSCSPDIYLDGLLVSATLGRTTFGIRPSTKTGDSNLNQYQVSDLAGIEYHTGATVPPEYGRTGSGCGVILLWTRER
jgi:hypothetical protein